MKYNLLQKSQICFGIFLLLLSASIKSTNRRVDSLEYCLKNAKNDTIIINTLIDLAIEYRTSDVKRAILFADSALSLSKQLNYKDGLANSYNRLGSLYLQQGYYLLAFENYFRALHLFDSLKIEKGMSHCYNGIGVIYRNQKNFSKALDFTNKALIINKKRNDSIGIAINYNNIGMIYFKMEQFEKAIEFTNKSLQIWQRYNDTDRIVSPLQTLGNIFYCKSEYQKSISFYNNALEIATKKHNKYHTAYSYLGIAKSFAKLNNTHKAILLLNKSLEYSNDLGLKDNIKEIYAELTSIYKILGDYKSAFQYQSLFISLQDSLNNIEAAKKISEIESLHLLRAKEEKISNLTNIMNIQNKHAKEQLLIRNFLIVGFCFILFLSILLIIFIKQKQKNTKLLESQYKEIIDQKDEIEEKNAELQMQQEEIESQNNALATLNESLEQINYELQIQSLAASKTDSAIIITDAFTNYIWVNDGCIKLYGYERNDFIMRFISLEKSSLYENISELLKDCKENKKSGIYESIDYTKDGKVLNIQTTITPIFNTDGHLDKWIIVDTDITNLKKVEKKLEMLNQDLEKTIQIEIQKNREKDLMLVQQSRLAAMGEMIGNIAHQWRQPLNAVGVIVQNLVEAYDYGELTQEYLQKRVDKSMELIQYMSQTINDFRNFFKPEKQKQYFVVGKVIEKAVSFVEANFRNLSISLKLKLQEEIMVYGYPNEYAQVIINILNNSRDVLCDKKIQNPEIIIEASIENENSIVRISDNGGGIEDSIIEKIFDPYFTTKPIDKGTGLGLYMSKTIIEHNMDGNIYAKNMGNGAEFTILLKISNC